MRRLLVIIVAASLILWPFATLVNAENSPSKPPIEQPLVSEGEFAVELATALKLTSSHDEAAAENSLSKINIAPKNGWISNYPVTPDIVAEVRDSTARSASAKTLKMPEAEATRIVDSVSVAMNLPVKAGNDQYSYESGPDSSYSSDYSSGYQANSSPPEVYPYEEPSEVEGYFDDYGPPVVTYYPPPWDYGYLYDWVPYPFWWGGWGFGGFFVLGDFDRHDHFHGHHHEITNHVTTANGSVTRVDPVTRAATGTANARSSTLAGANRSSQVTRLNSANAQAGARAILNRQNAVSVTRDLDRAASGSRVGATSRGSGPMSSSFNGGRSVGRVATAPSFSGGSRSYGGMSGFRGSGGYGGGFSGFHGGGGGFGGFHGGGGGFGGGGFHGGGGRR